MSREGTVSMGFSPSALRNFRSHPKITNLALGTAGHVQRGLPITHRAGKMGKQSISQVLK